MHYSQFPDQSRRSTKLKLALAAGLFTIGLVSAFLLISYEQNNVSIQISLDDHLYRQTLYQHWKIIHSKNYSQEEDSRKFQIFSQNYDFVQNFNQQPNMTFKVGMNQFADLSREEWRSFIGGCFKGASPKTQTKRLSTSNLPSSVDWRKKGAVTGVKNQGSCGSCWAFSSTGSLEGLNFITNKKLQSFSEQQLVDCSQSFGNQGCNGGLMDYAFKYTSTQGIESEKVYPYVAAAETCNYKGSSALFKNTGYNDVEAGDNEGLTAAVAQQPVSIGIEADSQSFQMYTSGVYNDPNCGTRLDHGVLIVGYGVDNQTKSPFWIVKNSWGSAWGESGFIRIARQSEQGDGICGIALSASYPVDNSENKPLQMIEIKPWIHPVGPEVKHEDAEKNEDVEDDQELINQNEDEEEQQGEANLDQIFSTVYVSNYEDLSANIQSNVYHGLMNQEEEEEEDAENGAKYLRKALDEDAEDEEEEATEEESKEEEAIENEWFGNFAEKLLQAVEEEASEEEASEEEASEEEASEEEASEEASEEEAGEEEASEEESKEEEAVENEWFENAAEKLLQVDQEEALEEEASEEEASEEEASEEEASEEASEEEAGEEEAGEEEASEEEAGEEEAGEEETREEASENEWFENSVPKQQVQADLLASELLHHHYYGIGPVIPSNGLRKYFEGVEQITEEEQEEETSTN